MGLILAIDDVWITIAAINSAATAIRDAVAKRKEWDRKLPQAD